jgi:hypothetical protein
MKNYFFLVTFVFAAKTTNAADPTVAPAAPTALPVNVISLFSNSYTNTTVNTWLTNWSAPAATITEVNLDFAGNTVKRYTTLDYCGVELPWPYLDISTMDFVHVDVWTGNNGNFGVKLVDVGPDGNGGTADDTEAEKSFWGLTQNAWNSIDIPLSDFYINGVNGPTVGRTHLSLMVLTGGGNTIFLDNFYFYKPPGIIVPTPSAAAPTPTQQHSNAISLFCSKWSYINEPVNTWSTSWGNATVTNINIAGNLTKKYTNLNVAGIDFTNPVIDVSNMDSIHFDLWTPDCTGLKVKLTDFGADGVFGGNNDVDAEITVTPQLNNWVSYNIALSDFAGLTTKNHLALMILTSANPNTVLYLDNVYFFQAMPKPTSTAPTPTKLASEVISLYSNVYTNVVIDNWATTSEADVSDVAINTNATKRFANLRTAAIDFYSAPINATNMNYLHLNVWTSERSAFKITLRDLGANGLYDNIDDSEKEIEIEAGVAYGWYTIEIPLAEFQGNQGLTAKAHLGQMILSGNDGLFFIDNIYFSKNATDPTKLLTFEALRQGTFARLKWSSTFEQNNAGYRIQASSNGINWATIGFVNANNTTATADYNFVDSFPLNGRNVFRLQQVNVFNQIKTSDNRELDFGDPTIAVQVWPNPASNFIIVKVGRIFSSGIYDIIDLNGRKVKSGMMNVSNANSSIRIDISNLQNGQYFIRYNDGKETNLSTKFIKGKF